jgi:hypothetical protein
MLQMRETASMSEIISKPIIRRATELWPEVGDGVIG